MNLFSPKINRKRNTIWIRVIFTGLEVDMISC